MDTAYLVSKKQLIDWVNELLCINITKVEQCASGAIYCQILDSLYPDTVCMKKVNWNLKHSYEFISNYKILQRAFLACSLQKTIDVDKLCKGKLQDNLETLQWFKYHHNNTSAGNVDYDPVSRRFGPVHDWAKHVKHEESFDQLNSSHSHRDAPVIKDLIEGSRNRVKGRPRSSLVGTRNSDIRGDTQTRWKRSAKRKDTEHHAVSTHKTKDPLVSVDTQNMHRILKKDNNEIERERHHHYSSLKKSAPITIKSKSAVVLTSNDLSNSLPESSCSSEIQMETSIDGDEWVPEQKHKNLINEALHLEGERDFYFAKLRQIEILCDGIHEQGADSLEIAKIQLILFANESESSCAVKDNL